MARDADLFAPCAAFMRVEVAPAIGDPGGGDAGELEAASLLALEWAEDADEFVSVAEESPSMTAMDALVAAVLFDVEDVIDDASETSEEFIVTEVGGPGITRCS